MKKELSINADGVIGKVSKLIYGGFVEHLGRNVYGGVFDPADPTADEDGFRTDSLNAIRELDTPITRYPGGCFSSSWLWEDGIGKNRPVRLDPAWKQLEPNTFGLDEFMKWARKANTEPMLTLNVGQRTAIDAERMLEYCNFPKGTTLSDQRRANGAEEPYGIRYVCLGNEQYGSWECGQAEPEEYARRARECAKLCRNLDPNLKFILCGNGEDHEWNRKVLEICFDYVDYLSLHFGFYTPYEDERYFASLEKYSAFLDETAQICEQIRLARKSRKKISISVDEWIVWDSDKTPREGEEWTTGMHLLEQNYTMRDVLAIGGLFSLFHNHADTVGIACVAQSFNVIAPIRTEKNGVLWKQGSFYPFYYASHYGRGLALRLGGTDTTLRGSVVYQPEMHEFTLFLMNYSHEEIDLSVRIEGFDLSAQPVEAVTIHTEDEKLFNTPEYSPLTPKPLAGIAFAEGRVTGRLALRSWNCIRFSGKEI